MFRKTIWAIALGAVFTTGPVQARELAVMQDKSALATLPKSYRCSANATITVTARDATFFDARLQEFGGLFGAALKNVFASCQQLRKVRVLGQVGTVNVQKATSEAVETWVLRLETSELQKAADTLNQKVRTYNDLRQLETTFKPFAKVAGINRTQGYAYYAQTAQNILNGFVLRGIGEFDDHVTKLIKAGNAPEAKLKPVYDAFALYRPDLVPVLQNRFSTLERRIEEADWAKALDGVFAPGTTIKQAAAKLRVQKGEPPDGYDIRVADWLSARVEAHEAAHPGTSLEELRGHATFHDLLMEARFGANFPVTEAAREDAQIWYADFVDIMMEEAVTDGLALIGGAAEGPEELDTVFEIGSALAAKFDGAGFAGAATQMIEATAARVEQVLTEGLLALRADLAIIEPTPEDVAALRIRTEVYGALTADFPEFAAYAELSDNTADLWEARICAADAKAAGGDDYALAFEGSELPLSEVSCRLMTNGHRLTGLDLGWNGRRASLDIALADEGPRQFDLVGRKEATLTLLTDKDGGNSTQWEETLASLLISPPTGVPDHTGHTECDILAGDPKDPAIQVGVDLNEVPPDYDFERAIDACIAASEVAPDDPRPIYQLARALEAVGEIETAQSYYQAAAGAGYAPAQYALGMTTLTYGEGDEAFFDAIDLFKLASKSGYAPAKAELAALIPPGTEIWREIPGPTDSEVMNTVKRKVCEGVSGFGACAIRTGVHRKECMQVSANAFSCELVLRMRCEVNMGNNPLMQLFSGVTEASCPRRTDPLFMKFTKTGARWSARSEF